MRRLVLVATLATAPAAAHADPVGWPQPDGHGSAVFLTYSFGNLFDGGFNTALAPQDLRQATAAAFALWSRYAPLHFAEVRDSGPPASETSYPAAGHPDIRIGYLDALDSGSAAHAHLPHGGGAEGLAGDIHLSNDISAFPATTWGRFADDPQALDYFSAMLHEVGHSLGVRHVTAAPAVMGEIFRVFLTTGDADLLPGDIAAIRAIYGAGQGSIRTLEGDLVPTPEPASLLLIGTGLALLARPRGHRRTRDGVPSPAPAIGPTSASGC